MEITEAQHEFAGQLVDLVADRLGSGRAVHPETAIATSARLAGSLLLRSFNLNLQGAEPGTVILSEEANEQGPQLIGILGAFLRHLGVSLDAKSLEGRSNSRGREPELSVLQSVSLLQDAALSAASEWGLELNQSAQAAALATAFIVKECANNIGAEVGFNIATYGFIEGAKTVPPSLGPEPEAVAEKKPWYKFW
jgi:hypothetical protein